MPSPTTTALKELLVPPLPKKPAQPADFEIVHSLKKARYPDIYVLPQWQMKRLTKLLREARNKKYRSPRHESKYKGVMRIPTRQQVQVIIANSKSEKARLIFKIMAQRGLRPNEAVRLKASEVFATQVEGVPEFVPFLLVHNTKCKRVEYCAIPYTLFAELKGYIARHHLRIQTHEDYLFYSVHPLNKHAHLSVDYLRNYFRKKCKKLGFNSVYAEVKHPRSKTGKAKRYNLTLYSLRHYAITKFYERTKDVKLTQLFARHTDPALTLEVYVEKHDFELTRAILGQGQQTLFNV